MFAAARVLLAVGALALLCASANGQLVSTPSLVVCNPSPSAPQPTRFTAGNFVPVEWSTLNAFAPHPMNVLLQGRNSTLESFVDLGVAAARVPNNGSAHVRLSSVLASPLATARYRFVVASALWPGFSNASGEFLIGQQPLATPPTPQSWTAIPRDFQPNDPDGLLLDTSLRATRTQSIYLPVDFGVTRGVAALLRGVSIRVREPPNINTFTLFVSYAFLPRSVTRLSSGFLPTQFIAGNFTLSNATLAVNSTINVTFPADPAGALIWRDTHNLLLEIAHSSTESQAMSRGGIWVRAAALNTSHVESSDVWTAAQYPNWPSANASFETFTPSQMGVDLLLQNLTALEVPLNCSTRTSEVAGTGALWRRLAGSGEQRVDCLDLTLPPCRSGHAMAVYRAPANTRIFSVAPTGPDGVVVLVFGGRTSRLGGQLLFNDLWAFANSTWRQVYESNCTSSLSRPSCRFGHSAVVMDRFLFVYGGQNASGAALGDLWRIELDTPNAAWAPAPGARPSFNHRAVTNGIDTMWVFGGSNGVNRTNQVLRLVGALAPAWQATPSNASEFRCDLASVAPCVEGHGMALRDGSIFVFGGTQTINSSGAANVTNALWRYSIANDTWELLVERDCERLQYPQCRTDLSAVVRPYGALAVYGGTVTLRADDDASNPRRQATIVSNDMWEGAVDGNVLSWFEVTGGAVCAAGARHECSSGAAAAQADGVMLVMGGQNVDIGSSVFLNSIWAYRLAPQVAPSTSALPIVSTAGGAVLTMRGVNFATNASFVSVRLVPPPAVAAMVGASLPCGGVSVLQNDSVLTCTVPPGVGGTYTVNVTVTDVTTWTSTTPVPVFAYQAPDIAALSLSPDPTPAAGGGQLLVRGANLGRQNVDNVTVTLRRADTQEETACAPVTWVNASAVQCPLPPGVGALSVRVLVGLQNSSQTTATVRYASPLVSNLGFANVSTAGGSPLVVLGANFGPASALAQVVLSFNNYSRNESCGALVWVSDGRLECAVPAGAGRDVAVLVQVAGEEAEAQQRLSYAAPTVDFVVPEVLRVNQRTRITVFGANFGRDPSDVVILVNGLLCNNVVFVQPHRVLTCDAPKIDEETTVKLEVVVAGQGLGETGGLSLQYEFERITGNVRTAMWVVAIIGELVLLMMLTALLLLHSMREIRASSPSFGSLVIIGSMIMVSSVFPLGTQTGAQCHYSYWLLILGFVIMFGSLLLKNYRILHIFNRQSLQVRIIPLWVMGVALLVMLAIASALLAVISANSRCGFANNTSGRVASGLLAAYVALLLAAGVAVAVMSRVITIAEFRERIELGYAIYNVSVSLLILVPVVVLFRDEIVPVYAVRSIGIVFVAVVTSAVVFGPKFYNVYYGPRDSSALELNAVSSAMRSARDLTPSQKRGVMHASQSHLLYGSENGTSAAAAAEGSARPQAIRHQSSVFSVHDSVSNRALSETAEDADAAAAAALSPPPPLPNIEQLVNNPLHEAHMAERARASTGGHGQSLPPPPPPMDSDDEGHEAAWAGGPPPLRLGEEAKEDAARRPSESAARRWPSDNPGAPRRDSRGATPRRGSGGAEGAAAARTESNSALQQRLKANRTRFTQK